MLIKLLLFPSKPSLARTFASKLATITVDNTSIQVPEDTLLIDAIRKAKIRVPTLCYNPRTKAGGTCRVCVVEDLARPGQPVISCRTPARDGMKIVTTSPWLNELRETNRTIALKKHPALAKKVGSEIKPKAEEVTIPNLDSIFAKYPSKKKEYTLPLAIDVTDNLGFIEENTVAKIAEHVGVDKNEVKATLDRYKFLPKVSTSKPHIYLCTCHNCRLKGQEKIVNAMKSSLGSNYDIQTMNWLGVCIHHPPAAMVKRSGNDFMEYLPEIKLEDMEKYKTDLIGHLVKTIPSRVQFYPSDRLGKDYKSLTSIIDIEGIAKKAATIPADNIFEKLKETNLLGCGGGGFPTHLKWKAVAQAQGEKFVVCNADEGLPSTFKDGWLLQDESMREKALAGIFICAKVVGAKKAYLYLRYEYRNLLDKIKDTEKAFKAKCPEYEEIGLETRIGAGTYIAGEETALFESIQGNPPIPRRNRPWFVYSTEKGLFDKPTVINNVETFANVPYILAVPAETLKAHGLPKLIGVVGDIRQPSLLEYPLRSLTLHQIIDEVQGESIGAAEVGGITEPLVLPKDFKRRVSFNKGDLSPVGSIVLFNKDRNLEEVYKNKLEFMQDECCRQCVPCREGSQMFCGGFDKVIHNEKERIDEKFFRAVALSVQKCGQCGHGRALGPLFVEALEYRLKKDSNKQP
eukprot:TRINITY_DN205_c0_g4_i2.p1 TRINITY_DN205_c0_g4~~TRINITY_DN205_c0_g4_i2.p1  ORF type:complete len:686 (+),score=62.37 TRINITY_DN205_c0_g4_i2:8756-10813(+)